MCQVQGRVRNGPAFFVKSKSDNYLITCQNRIIFGISINYRADADKERWMGRAASLEKFKEKSGPRILPLD